MVLNLNIQNQNIFVLISGSIICGNRSINYYPSYLELTEEGVFGYLSEPDVRALRKSSRELRDFVDVLVTNRIITRLIQKNTKEPQSKIITLSSYARFDPRKLTPHEATYRQRFINSTNWCTLCGRPVTDCQWTSSVGRPNSM